jgi:cAMP phosphodiesterase
MKVRVLGGSGGLVPGRLLTSFCIDQELIMDAGSMAEALPLEEQAKIRDILLTHAHLDHSGTLPFFVDNVFGLREDPFVVHSIPEVVKSVKDHLFNNDIWPDFSMIPDFKRAAMRFVELNDEAATKIGDFTVTSVRVHHTIPAIGFIIEQPGAAILFSGDTAQTERLWELASQVPNLKAAFIETSFPNRMQRIADVSGHLTPQTLRDELPKLQRDVPIFVYHIKPRFHDEVVAEIRALGHRDLHVVEQGLTYEFR